MSANRLREVWRSGRPAWGAWCSIPATITVEVMGKEEVDYIAIDCQHGLIDYAALVPMLQAVTVTGCTPAVRVPANDSAWIGKVLDAGAEVVIVPMVNTRADALRAVQACRYPPAGIRSFGPTRSGMYLGSDPKTVNAEVVCMVMVETAEGLENLDQICSTPGLDGIYIGPVDLSISLSGVPQLRDQTDVVLGAIERIRAACAAAGLASGIYAVDSAQAAHYAASGFSMINLANDLGLLRSSLRSELRATRSAVVEGA
jgi:4-hydroxy-2-oxoheptanedioate aldolase